jgi:hypothetical protein
MPRNQSAEKATEAHQVDIYLSLSYRFIGPQGQEVWI